MMTKHKKKLMITGVVAVVIGFSIVLAFIANSSGTNGAASVTLSQKIAFSQCLADAGVVIYGTRTCPACQRMVSAFGGYSAIAPVYVECTINQARCGTEMQTQYVPEVQINGVVFNAYQQPQDIPQALARATECVI